MRVCTLIPPTLIVSSRGMTVTICSFHALEALPDGRIARPPRAGWLHWPAAGRRRHAMLVEPDGCGGGGIASRNQGKQRGSARQSCLLRRCLLLHVAAPESIDVDTLAKLTLALPRWPSYPHDFFAHRKSTLTKRCLHLALLHPTGISEKSNAVRTKCPRPRGRDGLPFQLVVDHVPADDHVIRRPR